MTDIVERLRRVRANWRLCLEAIDEIERLRLALSEIRKKAATMPNGGAWAAGLANVALLGALEQGATEGK